MKNPFTFKRTPDGDLKNEAGFELRIYGMSGSKYVHLIVYSKDKYAWQIWDFSKPKADGVFRGSYKSVKNLTSFKKTLMPFMKRYQFLSEKTNTELLELTKDFNSEFMQALKKELEQLQKEHTA